MAISGEEFYIARTALLGLTVIAAVVVLYLNLRTTKRRQRRAKGFVLYFNLAFLAFISYLLLSFLAAIIRILGTRRPTFSNPNSSADDNIYQCVLILQLLSRFLDCVTEAFIFLTLASLNNGIAISAGIKQRKSDNIVKYMWYTPPAILAILALASFSTRLSIITSDSGQDFGSTEWDSGTQLNFGVYIGFLILSVGIMALCIRTRRRTPEALAFRTASKICLICSALWLLKTAYEVGYLADNERYETEKYDDAIDSFRSSERRYGLEITDVLFNAWPRFMILFLLFAKKVDSLWSDEKPSMAVSSIQEPQQDWQHSQQTYPSELPPNSMSQPHQQAHEIQSRSLHEMPSSPVPQHKDAAELQSNTTPHQMGVAQLPSTPV